MSIDRNQKINVSDAFNVRTIKKGILMFLVITVITLTAIFIYSNTGETIEVWKKLNVSYILLALGIMCLDLLLGSWRNHIFVREFNPGKSQWVSFRANLANIFMGALTPSQSGGGLAQLYIYHKNGVKLSDAITIGLINWISTLIFFPVSGLMAYYIISEHIPEGFIEYLARFGFTIFSILFVFVMIGLFFPKFVGWVIAKMANGVAYINARWKKRIIKFGENAKSTLIDYRNKCANLLRKKPHLMLYSLVLTFILYFNKYLLAYVLVIAFGLTIDFWVIIAIMAIVYLLLYFAPSPGGSGIAELSIAGLMVGIMNEDYLASFILLQRSFLVFIPVLLGVYVVLRQLGRDTFAGTE